MKQKKMKRILCAVLVLALFVFLFAGCGDNQDKVYKIGICQLIQHDALDAATNGFQTALKDKLGDKVEFDLKNAAGDSPTCATITNQFVADNKDLIMANATASLQAAMASTGSIPIVATSITDFATALDLKEWNGKTGINVTGTSDLAPLADQAKMIKELLPDVKTVGIMYCSGEPNSKYQANVVSAELDKLGIAHKEYTVADTTEIINVATRACDEVECLYVPTDNMLANAKAAVNEVAAPKKIPVIAGEEGICKGCGVATLSIDYYSIGYKAGEMAYEILVNKAKPGDMEIAYASELTKKYVPERATALNITVPDGYTVLEIGEAADEK